MWLAETLRWVSEWARNGGGDVEEENVEEKKE